jgi:hypothetical protein
MSIYSRTAGNQITDATDICSVRLRYHGDEAQTLQVRDMKLVYVDEAGGITAAYILSDSTMLTIDASLVVEIGVQDTPLSAPNRGLPPVVWIVLAAVVVIAIAMFLYRKRTA